MVDAYEPAASRSSGAALDPTCETFHVPASKYDRLRARRGRDALGGARVLVRRDRPADRARAEDRSRDHSRSRDGRREVLLVSNRDEPGWDLPGGAREAGESPAETARREVREEVGLDVDLGDLLQSFEFGFVPESDPDRDRIAGNWYHFDGTPVKPDAEIDIDRDELEATRWFDAPPPKLNRHARPIVREFFADR